MIGVERFHRNLKEALKARLLDNDWDGEVPQKPEGSLKGQVAG